MERNYKPCQSHILFPVAHGISAGQLDDMCSGLLQSGHRYQIPGSNNCNDFIIRAIRWLYEHNLISMEDVTRVNSDYRRLLGPDQAI
jgi:hypothetical protein